MQIMTLTDVGSIPESGRFPGGGNGNPLQYSCLEHPMGRGAWWATVCGVARVGHDWVSTQRSMYHETEIRKPCQNKSWGSGGDAPGSFPFTHNYETVTNSLTVGQEIPWQRYPYILQGANIFCLALNLLSKPDNDMCLCCRSLHGGNGSWEREIWCVLLWSVNPGPNCRICILWSQDARTSKTEETCLLIALGL